MKNRQNDRLLEYMRKRHGMGVTQAEAIEDLGIYRLAARISDLRKMGYTIERKMRKVMTRDGRWVYIAEYKLREE